MAVKCKECGQEFKHQGALNLHMYKKHKVQTKDNEQVDCCQNNKRLLNPTVPAEARAMEAGFKEVCTVCTNLYQ